MFSSISSDWVISNNMGKLFKWLTTLTRGFFISSQNFLHSSLCPSVFTLLLHPSERSTALPHYPLGHCRQQWDVPSLLFSSDLTNTALSVCSNVIYCSHWLPRLAPLCCLYCPGKPKNGRNTPNTISKCQVEQNKYMTTYQWVCFCASP